MNRLDEMSLMLVSVKLNQIERASGQPATSTISTNIGTRKVQATRVRSFIAVSRWRSRATARLSVPPLLGVADDHHLSRLICLSLPSSLFTASAPFVFFSSTSCAASQNARLTSGYLRPVTVAGRATAPVNTSSNWPMNGLAATTSLSLYRSMIVGWYDPPIARFFWMSALVMYITRSADASMFFEYFDTASCQPPNVAAF